MPVILDVEVSARYWAMEPTQRATVEAPRTWGTEEKRPLALPGFISAWKVPTMFLAPYGEHGATEALDYLSPVLLPGLCSERMRSVVEAGLGPKDEVQWLPVDVASAAGERLRYSMLRLPHLLVSEIIDEDQTITTENGIMKAVLRSSKIINRHLFRYPFEFPSVPIVSDVMRQHLLERGITGCRFELVPASG